MSEVNGMPVGDEFLEETAEIEVLQDLTVENCTLVIHEHLHRIETQLDEILEFKNGLAQAMTAMEESPMFGMLKGMMGG